MTRLLQALISGLCLGMGIGSALAEAWLFSALFFLATGIGLFVFVRSCLRRIF